MRVTPNQITISRVVLLPFPIMLFFHSGLVGKALALVVFLVLGITDFVDGYLARKYGSTEFGKFLDPISDKIFMAAIYLPLIYLDKLDKIPLWPVAIMFVREFLITELRTIYNFQNANFATSLAGKIKTNVQGFGAAFICLLAFFPLMVPRIVAVLAAVGIAIAGVVWKLKKGQMHIWFKYSIGCFAVAAVLICFLPSDVLIYIIAVGAMAISVYSGAEYLVAGSRELKSYLVKSPIVRTSYILVFCFIIPVGLLALAKVEKQLFFWPILLTLALAFISSGLDNYLSLKKIPYSYSYKWLKLAVQLIFLAWAIHLYFTGASGKPSFLFAILVIASGELVYCLGYIIRHFSQFVEGSRLVSAEEAAKGSKTAGK